MAQFDVYANPVIGQRREKPYLVEVQSDLLGTMLTTVVVPLVQASVLQVRFERLTPLIEADNQKLRFSVTEIFSLPRSVLGKPLFNLESERSRILGALDHVILGF